MKLYKSCIMNEPAFLQHIVRQLFETICMLRSLQLRWYSLKMVPSAETCRSISQCNLVCLKCWFHEGKISIFRAIPGLT